MKDHVPVIRDDEVTTDAAVELAVDGRGESDTTLRRSVGTDMEGLWKESIQILAHDVRNQIVAMNQNIELLLGEKGCPFSKSQVEIIRATRVCCDIVMGMTDDIVDLTRFESGSLNLVSSRFNLVEAITTSFCVIKGATTDKSIQVRLSTESRPVMIEADRSKIIRVLVNLLTNAIFFSPDGGRIDVRCAKNKIDGTIVSVSDEGPGVPHGLQQFVFKKFYRISGNGNSQRSGLGLGLYFCRETIKAHGGRIWIESPSNGRNRGTCVSFTIPASHSLRDQ